MDHSSIKVTINIYTHSKFNDSQKEVEVLEAKQQKVLGSAKAELQQIVQVTGKLNPMKNV